MRSIPNIFYSVNLWDEPSEDRTLKVPYGSKEMIKEFQDKFEKLRDRIERKRQEIQSLSDGVGHLHLANIQEGCRD